MILRQHLNDLQNRVDGINSCTCDKHKLEDLVNDFNQLKEKVNKFKSCNCDGNQFNQNLADLQNQIKLLRHRTNIDFNQLTEHVIERPQNTFGHQLTQTFNSMRLILDQFVEVSISPPSLEDVASNTNNVATYIENSVQTLRDRNYENPPMNYIWDVHFREWDEVEYTTPFPAGWRNNRDFDAPPNYLWDFNRMEWIRFTGGEIALSWRDEPDAAIPYLYNSNNIRGRIEWHENEWMWNDSYDNLHDRNWDAPLG